LKAKDRFSVVTILVLFMTTKSVKMG